MREADFDHWFAVSEHPALYNQLLGATRQAQLVNLGTTPAAAQAPTGAAAAALYQPFTLPVSLVSETWLYLAQYLYLVEKLCFEL